MLYETTMETLNENTVQFIKSNWSEGKNLSQYIVGEPERISGELEQEYAVATYRVQFEGRNGAKFSLDVSLRQEHPERVFESFVAYYERKCQEIYEATDYDNGSWKTDIIESVRDEDEVREEYLNELFEYVDEWQLVELDGTEDNLIQSIDTEDVETVENFINQLD